MFSNLFPKIVPFMRYVEKYGKDRHATDDNTIRRMYRHTLRICNFSRQKWLRLGAQILLLYVHLLSCSVLRKLLIDIS